MLKFTRIALLAVFALSAPSFASSLYNETASGDLSSDNLTPTALTFSAGDNLVRGSMGLSATGFDPDFFTFVLRPGQTLNEMRLTQYASNDNLAFLAIVRGAQFTTLTDPSGYLGNALIGTGDGRSLGDDILDDLGRLQYGGIGFNGSLPAGTYTVWFQEHESSVNYEFNFKVSEVPLPASAWMFMLALLGLFAKRKLAK
jgi:hypothetical protein